MYVTHPSLEDPLRRYKLTKTYGVFNRNTFAKTGNMKVTRKFSTRAEAREFKRSNDFKYGIVALDRMEVIR